MSQIPFMPMHPVFEDGKLYERVSDCDYWPWEHIQPDQWRMHDRMNGNLFVHDRSMERLDTMAQLLSLDTISINSGHRGRELNEHVGGAPRSAHRNIAFDIPLSQVRNELDLLDAAVFAGFASFGLYETFIHVDMRWGNDYAPTRFWWGSGKAQENWTGIGVKGKDYVTMLS